jgi:hypothetical protein
MSDEESSGVGLGVGDGRETTPNWSSHFQPLLVSLYAYRKTLYLYTM